MNVRFLEEGTSSSKLNGTPSPTQTKMIDYNGSLLDQRGKPEALARQTRQLMIKLTLPRLRKMQALVRGFLVRRKIYPPLLEEYLISQAVMNLAISNVVYKESSQIIL